MLEKKPTIKVLTSLFGLGVFIPARIAANHLQKNGFNCEVLLIEHLFTKERRETFERSKILFRENYKIAKLATKLSIDSSNMYAVEALTTLFKKWQQEEVREFVVFSGLWLELLCMYAEFESEINVKICRLDAGDAVTWQMNSEFKINKTYRFFDLEAEKINYSLSIPKLKSFPYQKRENCFVIHGGGWGLGTFSNIAEQLPDDHRMHIIVKDFSQMIAQKNTTYYINDPTWNPIHCKSHISYLPGLSEIVSGEEMFFFRDEEFHSALNLIANSKAIISKPGGMTLVDAIITTTPLIYLEPMGENEEGNQLLIERLKIGMSIDEWKRSNFSNELLLEFHHNMCEIKKNVPDLVAEMISDFTN